MALPTGLGQRALQSLNRPSALQFIGKPQVGAPATQPVPQNIMGLRQKVLEQQMRPQLTPAQQFRQLAGISAAERMGQTPPPPPPKAPTGTGGLLSGFMPEGGTPEMAGFGAAGQKLLELSGYREVPITMAEALGQAAGAYGQARGAALQQQKEEQAAQAAAERQAAIDQFERMKFEQEFGLKQKKEAREAAEAKRQKAPKLEEFYDEETGSSVKGYYSPENPQANKFGYVVVGGAKAEAAPKREVRNVAGVGLVDITEPENPKIIFQSEQDKARDLRSVAGVGVVDFSNPDDPKVLYESKQSETRRFQNIGAYLLDGEYIGEGTFDTKTDRRYIKDEQGNEIPIPFNAIPVTEGLMGKGIYTAAQMSAESAKVVELEKGLRQYTNYLGNLDKAEVGINRLADQMTTWMKTFISTKAKQAKLTEEELALAVADGQLQGLLGASRIDTVGGGVMTEQDALRVIKNLGGNVSMLQNPAVVREQISRLFYEKYMSYKDSLSKYNAQVNSFYKNMGYESKDPLKVNVNLLSPDMVAELGLATPTPEVTPDVSDITYTEDELNSALSKY